jgi:hypothetical protein
VSLRDELEQVRKTYGMLTPRAVVNAARNPSHPLHSRFEWNDAIAGERYRLEQARELIRTVRCTFVSPTSGPSTVRVFHSVPATPASLTPTYEPLDDILADPVAHQVLVAEMRRDWAAFEARYRHLGEFVTLVGTVAAALSNGSRIVP